MKFNELLSRMFFRIAMTVPLILACVPLDYALAGCGTTVTGGIPTAAHMPVEFRLSGYKMFGYKAWYSGKNFTNGSIMALDSVSVSVNNCLNLSTSMGGSKVAIVYEPPVGAVQTGNKFRIPSDANGVALDIEFPGNLPTHKSGNILLGTSARPAISTQTAASTSGVGVSFVVKLTLVKTGDFSGLNDRASAVIFSNGLGNLRYYNSTTDALEPSKNILKFPDVYGANYNAHASTPLCEFHKIGDVFLGSSGPKTITMPSISSSDFKGVGAVDTSMKVAKLKFACSGDDDTQPAVYFNADHPFGDSVGMSKDGGDVGIQILLNGVAVKFGTRSATLGWNRTLLTESPPSFIAEIGNLAPRGSYCKSNCGTTAADMTGPNWVDGKAAYGNNDGFDSDLTFKYYQTTNTTPAAQTFSVPFTVTIEVQ